jgi:cation:H+ antiporter
VSRTWIILAFAACIPAVILRATGTHLDAPVQALVYGAAILGGAFILSWAAEVAQLDVSQGLAVAILALICVLPEYAVDMYFAWQAAVDPQYAHYAAANMTGANRLLVGFGWPAVFLIYALRFKKRAMRLERGHRTEIVFLGLATIYSFILPFKKSLGLMDTAVFLVLFGLYAWRTSRAEVHEPELVGPARLLGALRSGPRRLAVVSMFAWSAVVILASAEPFAESLVTTGRELGIDEFLLVQWLAPLASEAPEFIVALLWAFRGDAAAGLGALVSSKVNQWTLLIGTLPVAYSLHLGRPGSLPLDLRQQHELLLTACQSLFAVAVLLNLRLSWYGAVLLFGLFGSQLVFEHIRVPMSYVYLALALLVFIRDRADLRDVVRHGAGAGGGSAAGSP